jgi:hypothetical protein
MTRSLGQIDLWFYGIFQPQSLKNAGLQTLCAMYPGMGIASISSQIGFGCRAVITALICMGFVVSPQTRAFAS